MRSTSGTCPLTEVSCFETSSTKYSFCNGIGTFWQDYNKLGVLRGAYVSKLQA